MTKCGCGFPMSVTGKGLVCTACDLADQRRRSGHCVDCGSPDRSIGVYCESCFTDWSKLLVRKGLEPVRD